MANYGKTKKDRKFQKGAGKVNKSALPNKYEGRTDYGRQYPNKNRDDCAVINDPDWYYVNEQLGFDSANLPWAEVLGMPFDRDFYRTYDSYITETDIDTAIHDTRFPGVMAFEIAPTIGKSVSPESAINVAARAIYAHVRKDNSGAKNYESTDLMMYYLAMDSLYSLHTWLTRLYGLTRVVAQQNRYVNRVLLGANNVNPDDLVSNLADFRAYINALGVKIAQFAVPNVFPYLKRHAMLYRDVYRDSEVTKCQFYMYVPSYFYKYVEKTTSAPAYLDTVSFGKRAGVTSPLTWAGIKTKVDTIVTSMVSAGSFALMSGDTVRAYGEGNCYVVPMITEDYATIPVFNTEILQQIKNIKSYPLNITSTARITQEIPSSTDPDTSTWLKSDLDYVAKTPILGGAVITVDKEHPDYKDNLIATRLCAIPAPKDVAGMHTANSAVAVPNTFYTYGSEVCCGMHIYTYIQGGIWTSITMYTDNNYVTDNAATVPAYNLYALGRVSKFNYHPEVRIWTGYRLSSSDPLQWLLAVDEQMLDNYTNVPPQTMLKMDTCALLGLFRTPQMGTVNL